MSTNTWVELKRETVTGSPVSSITFSGISSEYTDLVLVGQYGSTASEDYLQMVLNGDTATNYSMKNIAGNGSTVAGGLSSGRSAVWIDWNSSSTNAVSKTCNVSIMSYANASIAKSILIRDGRATSTTPLYTGASAQVALWNKSPEAITSILLKFNPGNNILVGSTFSLYGIKAFANAESTPKATGGEVFSDTTYWYHAFKYSGSFVPSTSITCDYLLIAGGGGGGGDMAGGGGAGGLRSTLTSTGGLGTLESAISLGSGTTYTVTIGAGAAAMFTDSTSGNVGSNSSIAGSGLSTLTATGGGSGGYFEGNGGSGGSGGGSGRTQSAGSGGARTASPVQGFNGGGGSGSAGTTAAAGGGGGAGAVGTNGSTSGAGAGGIGLALPAFATATATGVTTYYAGGGAGGAYDSARANGGLGGGGIGGKSGIDAGAGGHGVSATGSGGGGGGPAGGDGGAGGSGLVIIRYAK